MSLWTVLGMMLWKSRGLEAMGSDEDERANSVSPGETGVGLAGIEPATSSLSGMRSNRLSYSPAERTR